MIKNPVNLHYTAFVSNGGRRDKSIPGLFLRFSPEAVGIMGGCYYASTEQRQKIRHHIGADIAELRTLIKILKNLSYLRLSLGLTRGQKTA